MLTRMFWQEWLTVVESGWLSTRWRTSWGKLTSTRLALFKDKTDQTPWKTYYLAAVKGLGSVVAK